jgi:hypothetical protein
LSKSTVIIGAIVITLLISSVSSGNVSASGPRLDYPEDGEASEEANECHLNGYDSGFAGKYDSERARYCYENGGDAYNFAWGIGCEDSSRTEKECGELINNPIELEEEDYGELKDENATFCYDTGQEDGEAGKPYNEGIEDGCYEFGGINRDYTAGYQSGCEKHTTQASCELLYKDKRNYCPDHPDIAGCADFMLNNSTYKFKENPDSVCAGAGDPRPNIICPQETNPERYCLMYDNPFCKFIGDLCDDEGFVRPEYPYCTAQMK